MKESAVREKIVTVATDLFYRDGIHATGINTIIADAQIARMSLYHHFPSKDALIEAVLRRHFERTREELQQLVARDDQSPREKLRHFFTRLGQITRSPEFFGCPFINTTAEYSDPTHDFHRLAAEYKRMYREFIGQILEPLPDTESLAAQIFLLVEGTLVSTQVDAGRNAGHDALTASEILLDFYQKR